jgi:hypothetical protein
MEVEIAKNIEETKRKEFDEKINLLIGNPKPLIDKIKVLILILEAILEYTQTRILRTARDPPFLFIMT